MFDWHVPNEAARYRTAVVCEWAECRLRRSVSLGCGRGGVRPEHTHLFFSRSTSQNYTKKKEKEKTSSV